MTYQKKATRKLTTKKKKSKRKYDRFEDKMKRLNSLQGELVCIPSHIVEGFSYMAKKIVYVAQDGCEITKTLSAVEVDRIKPVPYSS